MAISLPPTWLTQILDNNGDVLAGGLIYTYAAGTTTPLETFSDNQGSLNTNPIVLDSAGRCSLWLTQDTSYKFVVEDSDGNTLLTVDDIVSVSAVDDVTTVYEVALTYVGSPGAQALLAAHQVVRSFTFPVDFTGADGSVGTNPGADYAVSVQKNGAEIGTCTFDTAGTPTFATNGGAVVSCVFGDRLSFVAPDTGTAADIAITLVGAL